MQLVSQHFSDYSYETWTTCISRHLTVWLTVNLKLQQNAVFWQNYISSTILSHQSVKNEFQHCVVHIAGPVQPRGLVWSIKL